MTTVDRVLHVIGHEVLNNDDFPINITDDLTEDLKLDEDDKMWMVVQLEDQFNMVLDDTRINHLCTVQDVVNYIDEIRIK
jgi:acyl carrier protein